MYNLTSLVTDTSQNPCFFFFIQYRHIANISRYRHRKVKDNNIIFYANCLRQLTMYVLQHKTNVI